MVNKPKMQGTAWETEFVRRAQDAGLVADRLAEGGSFDPGDVWISSPPGKIPDPDIPILAWKRLTGSGSRRTPDGIRDVVVMTTDDFLALAKEAATNKTIPYGFVVECKARQNLNVTRTLAKTIEKLNKWKDRR